MNSVKERNSVRGREYSEHSEVLCYSHVRLHFHSVHPPLLHQRRAGHPLPAFPSCLPAAVQSYEVVMSLVVMSLTLNLTSPGLKDRKKPHSESISFP